MLTDHLVGSVEGANVGRDPRRVEVPGDDQVEDRWQAARGHRATSACHRGAESSRRSDRLEVTRDKAELSFLTMVIEPVQYLIPVGRFGSLVRLTAAGFLLPRSTDPELRRSSQEEASNA